MILSSCAMSNLVVLMISGLLLFMMRYRSVYLSPLLLGVLFVAVFALGLPMEAWAQNVTDDVSSRARGLAVQSGNIPKLLAVGSYIIGVAFAIKALFSLRAFVEKPDDNPVNVSLSYAAIGALMILLPYIIGVTRNTIGAKGENQDSSAALFNKDLDQSAGLQMSGNTTNSAVATAADQTVVLAKQGGNIAKLIAVFCYIIGVFYTARALLALKNYIANSAENPINNFLGYGAIGSLLIVLPFSIATMGNTLAVRFPQVESSQRTFEDEAQFTTNNNISTSVNTLESLFSNLSLNFVSVSKLLAIFAYVMAAVIMLVGLLHLKNYGDDPSQGPAVRSIVMKFVLAAMLVSLPFAMRIFVTTVTGASDFETQDTVGLPCMMNGSGLSALRGTAMNGNRCQ